MNMLRWSSYAVALTLFGVAGCAQTKHNIPLDRAQSVPGALGQVKAEKTEQGNTKLAVEVEHLAPPEDLAKGAQVYVVWARKDVKDAKPQNIGALEVGKDRKGKLETVTPLDKFKVSITPESSPTAEKPTHAPIMSADVVSKD
jgi:hypothetical protein